MNGVHAIFLRIEKLYLCLMFLSNYLNKINSYIQKSFQQSENEEFTYAEFFFKCCEHVSLGENDRTVPLHLIKTNLKEIPCLSCGDVW